MAYKVVKNGREYYKITPTGRVPLTAEEYGALKLPAPPGLDLDGVAESLRVAAAKSPTDIPAPRDIPKSASIINEQGVSNFERWSAKNLYANPEDARKYLEGRNYEVRRWGDGFNFAVRLKGKPDNPWRVLDPEYGKDVNFQPVDINKQAERAALFSKAKPEEIAAAREASWNRFKEFSKDILDLTLDGAQVATAMMSGGGSIPAQILRTTFRSGSLELAREAAGSVQSGENNIHPGMVAAQGALGGATVAVPPVFHYLFDTVGGGLLKFGARIIGVGQKGGTELTSQNVLRMRGGYPGFGQLETYSQAIDKLRNVVKTVGDRRVNPFPESIEADTIATLAEGQGVRVPAAKAMDFIDSLIEKAVETPDGKLRFIAKSGKAAHKQFVDKGLSGDMQELMEDIYKLAEANGIADVKTAAEPTFLIALRRDLQDRAANEGAYKLVGGSRPRGTETRRAYAKAAEYINDELHRVLDATQLTGPQGMGYSQAMGIVADKTRWLKYWQDAMFSGKNDPEAINHAMTVIGGVFNKGKGGTLEAALNFDRLFGTDITSLMRQPVVGELFGDLGEASLVPRFAASGVPLGSATLGGAIGYRERGIAGTLPGAVAGAMLASPKSVLAFTKLGEAAAASNTAVGSTVKPFIIQGAQEAMRRMRDSGAKPLEQGQTADIRKKP